MAKKSISLSLDKERVKRLKEEAKKVNRSASQYNDIVLKEHFEDLDNKEEKEKKVEK